jgi:tetratricopeptide (TPR) repeat protein
MINSCTPAARLVLAGVGLLVVHLPTTRVAAAAEDHAIVAAVEKLGAARFRDREAAASAVWAFGEAAVPALEAAVASDDPELRQRAQRLLRNIRLGLSPDMPPAEMALISQFVEQPHDQQIRDADALFARGPERYLVLVKLSTMPISERVRRHIWSRLEADDDLMYGVEAAPALRALAQARALHGTTEDARNCIALAHADGATAGLLADWQRQHERAPTPRLARALTLLLLSLPEPRPVEALTYARRADDPVLLHNAQCAAGRHAEAASRHVGAQGDLTAGLPVTELARTLHAAVAAGDDDVTAGATAQLVARAHAPGLVTEAVCAMLAAGVDAEAVRVLTAQNDDESLIALHTARLDYDKALAVSAGITPATDGSALAAQLVDRLMLAHSCGAAAEADAALKALSESPEVWQEVHLQAALVEVCVGTRRFADARRYAARALSKGTPADAILPPLQPAAEYAAILWWQYLAATQPEKPIAARVNAIWELDVPPRAAARTDARAVLAWEKESPDRGAASTRLRDLASLCWRARDSTAAEAVIRRLRAYGSEYEVQSGLAELHWENGRWQAAADAFGAAAEAQPGDPEVTCLQGHALKMAGQVAVGDARIKQARTIPFDSVAQRVQLAATLRQFGLYDDANTELALAVRTGDPASPWRMRALRLLLTPPSGDLPPPEIMTVAEVRFRLAQELAAAPQRRDVTATVWAVAMRHFFDAHNLLAAGDTAAALTAAQAGIARLPSDPNPVIQLVNALSDAGAAGAATSLLASGMRPWQEVVAAYPGHVNAYNNMAWLLARTGRRLTEARGYAEKAVQMVPDAAAYLDTLAEVLFRLGERDAAVQREQRCIALDPEQRFFQEQLRRFRGD